jgi:hypothetical protein
MKNLYDVCVKKDGEFFGGRLSADSVDFSPESFIGEDVNVFRFDENGNKIEFTGKLIEIL